MYDYGFIGAGNMGTALAAALPSSLKFAISNRTPDKAEKVAQELGGVCSTNSDIAQNSKFIILAVKPQVLPELLSTIKSEIAQNKYKPVLVTMAAGVKIDTICKTLGAQYPVIRIMPNTPVSIGRGVILCARNDKVGFEDFTGFIRDFSGAGMLMKMPEEQIDAASVISGCGPAYIYMYIEALAKAGESLGLDFQTAASLAAATAQGAASLSMVSDQSLEDLRIAVCSPGGSTIEGVRSLISSNLYENVKDALVCAYNRTKELSDDK